MKTHYKNLQEFIRALDAAGELKTITRPVSHYLEISKLTDAESKSPNGGRALYFQSVKGSPFPAATNLFGSPKRIGMALGVDNLDRLGDKIRALIETSPPKTFREMIGLLPIALSMTRFFPRLSKSGKPPCQEVVLTGDDVDLSILPVLHCWPKDAGRFVTLPMVFTKSLSSGKRNVGMYRLQIFDRKTTGMHWHVHKDGSNYAGEYRRAGKRMPVAVAIGADPAAIYAATAPMPRNVDEMILAGFIRNKPVALAKCLTVDMEVPADAEFVLEGYVDPDEMRLEGPFGDHTGYYSLADDYPVFHVTAITHRQSPVYCATLVGRPPMEDCYLAKATERMFLPLLQTAFPEILDYWLPWEGVFHNIVIVSIRKEYPMHAQKVMSGLWGQGQMSFCKAIVVTDEDTDPKNPEQVLASLVSRFDIMSDVVHSQGVLDVLDHSSPHPNYGNKIGIDLTRRFPGEPERKTSRTALAGIPDSRQLLEETKSRCPGVTDIRFFPGPENDNTGNRILFAGVEKNEDRTGAYFTECLLKTKSLEPFNIILLFDSEIDLSDNSLLLWKLFNNVDPGRDLRIRGGRCVADACKKHPYEGHAREWPDELVFD